MFISLDVQILCSFIYKFYIFLDDQGCIIIVHGATFKIYVCIIKLAYLFFIYVLYNRYLLGNLLRMNLLGFMRAPSPPD